MEKYAMVKTEVQANGDIFLFYVDENGAPIEQENGVITTIDQEQLQQLQENYILEEIPADNEVVHTIQAQMNDMNDLEVIEEASSEDEWTEDEIKKLLIFYIDNKESFRNNTITKNHLWSVASKMVLVGKTPQACEAQLEDLQTRFFQLYTDHLKKKVDPFSWPFYNICYQAFYNDAKLKELENSKTTEPKQGKTNYNIPASRPEESGTIIMKKITKPPDEKVLRMLEFYLKYKREYGKQLFWKRNVWDKMAQELGEDADYLHKRYLNYKTHYLKIIEARNQAGVAPKWPYTELFDQIYEDDLDFQKKHGPIKNVPLKNNSNSQIQKVKLEDMEWNETEKTVLVKHYYDCFDEFQDPSVPKGFLWNEIGRLLDKSHEECKKKYEELKKAHLNLYLEGDYSIPKRKPIAILFDSIISQEVEKKICSLNFDSHIDLQWPTEKIDTLVQFIFDNIELFKDPICHFVCWSVLALKLDETVKTCKMQWNYLTTLYKSILNDKKEEPDMEIDWRYIDIFDRIFDYGMDTNLLEGYENKFVMPDKKPKKVVIGKPATKDEQDAEIAEEPTPKFNFVPEVYDDQNSGKDTKLDQTAVKILEYYMKNREKISKYPKKMVLWKNLSQVIGVSPRECAERFKNLKEVYTAYILREINKPEQPILWPYYTLCKKAIGYRAIKNKLRSGNFETEEVVGWSPREIKTLISFAGQHLEEIGRNPCDTTLWANLLVGKSAQECCDKFFELNEFYQKTKIMMVENPASKVTWKYFRYFEQIYSVEQSEDMDVDTSVEQNEMVQETTNTDTTEKQDEDFQCIIVLPEDQEIKDISNAQIIIKDEAKSTPKEPPRILWSKSTKMALVTNYYEYLKENEGKVINKRELWQHIGEKLRRKPMSCQRMYIKIKSQYKSLKQKKQIPKTKTKLFSVVEKILSLKSKFVLPPLAIDDMVLKQQAIYTDVTLPLWKVEKALKYYLEHVEEFVNPKYDETYAWKELSKASDLPLQKIFNKIHYLKQSYNSDETNEVNSEKFDYSDIVKEILEKEFICKIAIGNIPDPNTVEDSCETIWTDEETERLLNWYLENLDKFKNPKYVPSYLWLEALNVLNRNPCACSRKMNEIRSQYSSMAKENPSALSGWRFYELCQKIYGTGKKSPEQVLKTDSQ